MGIAPELHCSTRARQEETFTPKPLTVPILLILTALLACSEAALSPTPVYTPTSIPEAERNNLSEGNIPTVSESNMVAKWPTANVLNPIIWLGCHQGETTVPIGSGVIINLEGSEYLLTAFHVAEPCGMNPLVRFNNTWNAITWKTVAISEADDIAVLQTGVVLDNSKIPVKHGMVKGTIYGQIGYALGYPGISGENGPETDHVSEIGGKPIPIAALAISNFASTGKGTYSSSYINAGFSGGAIVFPVGTDDWTIAGIITHFPTVRRPVYRDSKETGDYILQHTGLVGFTPLKRIEELIGESGTKGG